MRLSHSLFVRYLGLVLVIHMTLFTSQYSSAQVASTSLSQNTWIAYLFPQDTTMAANLKTAAANGNVNTEIATANAQLQALAPYAPMPISVMGSSFTIPRTITPASIAAAQANSNLIPAATYASMVAANNYSGILSAEVAAARTMVTNATALIPAQTILTATQTYGPQLAAYLNQGNYAQAFAFASANGLMKYMETSYGLELLGIKPFSQAQMTAFFTAAGPYWNINILGTNPYSNTLWGDPGKLAGDAATNFQTSDDNQYPDLARFAGKRPSGGSIFGKILLAVAAVVATVFTAGAAAAVIGPALGAALGTSAAIGGAIAGAAASTVLNTAIDVAEGQSLGSAFTGSLVSAAVGGVLGGTDLGSLTSSSVANGAIDGAVGGAATGLVQGGNIGKDVLGGALGGGIAAGIDPAIDTLDNGNQYATKAIGGALAYGAAAAATGQNIVIAAANGAGSGIGQAAGATFANQYNNSQNQQGTSALGSQSGAPLAGGSDTATEAAVASAAAIANSQGATTSAIAAGGSQTSGFSLDQTSTAYAQSLELAPIVTAIPPVNPTVSADSAPSTVAIPNQSGDLLATTTSNLSNMHTIIDGVTAASEAAIIGGLTPDAPGVIGSGMNSVVTLSPDGQNVIKTVYGSDPVEAANAIVQYNNELANLLPQVVPMTTDGEGRIFQPYLGDGEGDNGLFNLESLSDSARSNAYESVNAYNQQVSEIVGAEWTESGSPLTKLQPFALPGSSSDGYVAVDGNIDNFMFNKDGSIAKYFDPIYYGNSQNAQNFINGGMENVPTFTGPATPATVEAAVTPTIGADSFRPNIDLGPDVLGSALDVPFAGVAAYQLMGAANEAATAAGYQNIPSAVGQMANDIINPSSGGLLANLNTVGSDYLNLGTAEFNTARAIPGAVSEAITRDGPIADSFGQLYFDTLNPSSNSPIQYVSTLASDYGDIASNVGSTVGSAIWNSARGVLDPVASFFDNQTNNFLAANEAASQIWANNARITDAQAALIEANAEAVEAGTQLPEVTVTAQRPGILSNTWNYLFGSGSSSTTPAPTTTTAAPQPIAVTPNTGIQPVIRATASSTSPVYSRGMRFGDGRVGGGDLR